MYVSCWKQIILFSVQKHQKLSVCFMVEVHSSVKSICLNTFFMLVENAIFLVELLLRCISTVPSVFHVGSALSFLVEATTIHGEGRSRGSYLEQFNKLLLDLPIPNLTEPYQPTFLYFIEYWISYLPGIIFLVMKNTHVSRMILHGSFYTHIDSTISGTMDILQTGIYVLLPTGIYVV